MTTPSSSPSDWQTPDGLDLRGAVVDIMPSLARVAVAIRGRAWVEDLGGLPVAGTPDGHAALRLPLHVTGTPVGTLVLAGAECANLEAIGALTQGHLCEALESAVTIGEFVETVAWQWKQINFLLDVSRSLDPTSTAPQVCTTILQRLVRVLGATSGTVRLVDATGQLAPAASERLDHRATEPSRIAPWDGVAHWVFRHETSILIETEHDLPRGVTWPEPVRIALGESAFLAAPLPAAPLSGGRGALGVLEVSRERGRSRFTAEDLKLLRTAAAQMSVAIHHTQLLAQAKEAERLRREVEMAAEIQARLLPQTLPSIPGLELRGWYRPATVVGGDYYDLIPLGPSGFYFAIADISGHGVASALFMSNARSVVRALLIGAPNLGAVAETLNQRIFEDSGDSGMFLTAILGRYDVAEHRLTLVNCGHTYPVLVRESGDVVMSEAGSPPVGMLPVLGAEGVSLDVAPGDLLFLYTDGLVETWSPREEMFGLERAVTIVRGGRREPLDVIGGRLLDALQAFRERPELEDDLTMLMIRRSATGPVAEGVDG